jgi:hypothetical protein
MTPKGTRNKSEYWQVELHWTKLLHNKGNNPQNEKASCEMVEIFANYIYNKRLKSKTYITQTIQ